MLIYLKGINLAEKLLKLYLQMFNSIICANMPKVVLQTKKSNLAYYTNFNSSSTDIILTIYVLKLVQMILKTLFITKKYLKSNNVGLFVQMLQLHNKHYYN